MEQRHGCIYKRMGGDPSKELCGKIIIDHEKNRCIFHAEKKDLENFKAAIKKQLDGKNYDFEGYIFPERGGIFAGVIFEVDMGANFENATFLGSAFFPGAIFKKEVDFTKAAFKDEANFEGTTFKERVSFSGAIFEGEANFGSNTTFKGEANFVLVTFKQNTTFNAAIFEDIAIFKNSVFIGRNLFEKTMFQKSSNFERCRFQGPRTLFWGTVFTSNPKTDSIVNFKEAELENVSFRNTNLTKTTFFGSKIDKVDFRDPEFLKTQDFIKRGNVLYDEDLLKDFKATEIFSDKNKIFNDIFLSEPQIYKGLMSQEISQEEKSEFLKIFKDKSFEEGMEEFFKKYKIIEDLKKSSTLEVKRLYLDLKKNAEEMRDYQLAGDFHTGEMEMALKAEGSWFKKTFILLYKLFSGYGENYSLAFWWNFNLAFIIFPFLYWYFGIKISGETFSTYFNFGHSLAYSLITWIPIPKGGIYQPGVSNWSLAFTVIESILGPILITLFLLALRRRFKR